MSRKEAARKMKVNISIDPQQVKDTKKMMEQIYVVLADNMTNEEEEAFRKSLNLYDRIMKAAKKV